MLGVVCLCLLGVWVGEAGGQVDSSSKSKTSRPVWSPQRPSTTAPAPTKSPTNRSTTLQFRPTRTAQATTKTRAQTNPSVKTSQRKTPQIATHPEPEEIIESIGPIVGTTEPILVEPSLPAGAVWDEAHVNLDACGIEGGPCYGSPGEGFLSTGGRIWGRSELLVWWTRGMRTPALVTQGTNGSLGELGRSGTNILFGAENLNDDTRLGGRFTLGYWLDSGYNWGVEASFFFVEEEGAGFDQTSFGSPLLARPLFNVVTGAEDSLVFAQPGVVAGSIEASTTSRLHGFELLMRHPLARSPGVSGVGDWYSIDALVGYRFLRLEEDIKIVNLLESAGPTTIDTLDLFDTRNDFHGAEFGVSTHFRRNQWSLGLLMKLGIGATHARSLVDGSTTTRTAAGTDVDAGGLLALSPNIARRSRDEFTMVPEVGLTLGYDITSRLQATFGYTLIYWSRVARPGDQIDRNINRSSIPNNGPTIGAPRPEPVFVFTDYWVQGMNFGLEYRY